ncbi:Metallo-dependent phosphatase-like protein [Mycotypha africana]|uniref:Metallo-dependent phosphatase-like protein n=1 Tax=Mycotypha africana TaxID=64632 RepID=UPI002300AB4E|nr:Metallo-dependent phosphatase-like protein [Mycotypha africana]KAI8984202.1 Metallo-dependent phosphatase-like protein [Mycotypha africana]
MKLYNLIYSLTLLLLVETSASQQQQQQSLQVAFQKQSVVIEKPAIVNYRLHGRFLHITDIHLDKHYLEGATIKSDCHRAPHKHKKKKKRQGKLAGYWGAPGTDCDSPRRLVHHAIDTIARDWKDKIDFILWTGDNARHDGDVKLTRTKKEILGYNKKVTQLIQKAFTLDNNRTLPIVPCIGNNDVHPHNQLRGMKNNPQLLEYSQLWSDFIPQDQQKHFRKGGYFASDVVPGAIRVLSLNSLYFFGSNDIVSTCSDPTSPGYQHVQWMKKQLKKARQENMKVLIIGHVPPTVKTFKDSCLDDYIKLSTKYADLIIGHMYGHSNMDHFQIISRKYSDVARLSKEEDDDDDNDDGEEEGSTVEWIQKDADRFISTLHKQYRKLQKIRDREDLVVIHVAPPMLPLFYPTFRINEYNADMTSSHFGDWLRYTQWYSNLTYWNEQVDNQKQQQLLTQASNKEPWHTKPEFEIEYSTDETYNMTDLTSSSWFEFAERISSKEGHDLWKVYLSNMFVQSNNDWYGQSLPEDDHDDQDDDQNNENERMPFILPLPAMAWFDWLKQKAFLFAEMLL